MRFLRSFILVLFCAISLLACQPDTPKSPTVKPALPASVPALKESPVREIPLAGPAANPRAEISGMAWCGTELILLPQYPQLFGEDGGANVFVIPEADLDAFIDHGGQKEIEPKLIPFETGGLEGSLEGFEGFEAIVFASDQFYVTIEARPGGEMMGYLVGGSVEGDCSRLTLNAESILPIDPQAEIGNMSHETLLVYDDRLYAIYEANGINVNPEAIAHVFDLSLQSRSEIPMPNIEYRVTDAAQPDESGEFWAINYFFPGESSDLQPALDSIAVDFGVGQSHRSADPVERLIKLKISDEGIVLMDQVPIYLVLGQEDSRNWEGLVRFGEGFLMVTDKFPSTILAYIEPPK